MEKMSWMRWNEIKSADFFQFSEQKPYKILRCKFVRNLFEIQRVS